MLLWEFLLLCPCHLIHCLCPTYVQFLSILWDVKIDNNLDRLPLASHTRQLFHLLYMPEARTLRLPNIFVMAYLCAVVELLHTRPPNSPAVCCNIVCLLHYFCTTTIPCCTNWLQLLIGLLYDNCHVADYAVWWIMRSCVFAIFSFLLILSSLAAAVCIIIFVNHCSSAVPGSTYWSLL